MSIDEFARTTPVRLPILNNSITNPSAHKQAALYVIRIPYIVASHMKSLFPVGTAMIIVADVKYARVSTSVPTVCGVFISRTPIVLLLRQRLFLDFRMLLSFLFRGK
jgi:hypothetical protein